MAAAIVSADVAAPRQTSIKRFENLSPITCAALPVAPASLSRSATPWLANTACGFAMAAILSRSVNRPGAPGAKKTFESGSGALAKSRLWFRVKKVFLLLFLQKKKFFLETEA
jgi:hypothetical protein